MLVRPQLARAGVNGKSLWIAMAVAPDFGQRVRPVPERIVRRREAVGVNANDLPEMAPQILRLVPMVEIADRHEQVAIEGLQEAAAETRVGAPWPGGTEYRSQLIKSRRLPVGKSCPRNRRPTAAGNRLDIAEVDGCIVRIAAVEGHIEQSWRTVGDGMDAGNALDRRRQDAIRGDNAQASRPLADEHAATWEECQTPRLLQSGRLRFHGDLAGGGPENLRSIGACMPCKKSQAGDGYDTTGVHPPAV